MLESKRSRAIVKAAIICDQVRREDNGKNILIGVYGGDLVVPDFPAMLTLALWFECEFHGKGDLPIGFRLRTDRGTKLFEVGFTAELSYDSTQGSFSFNDIAAPLTDPCSIIIEVREYDHDWIQVKSKLVVKAQPPKPPKPEAG